MWVVMQCGWVSCSDVLKEHCASSSGAEMSQKSAKHGMDGLTNYTYMVLLVSGRTERW